MCLSRPSATHTQAAIVFIHSRESNADSMVSHFLPAVQDRYSGAGGGVRDRMDPHEDNLHSPSPSPVAVIAIEAHSNEWYPHSHNATEETLMDENGV